MTQKWKRNKAGSLLGTWKAVYITKLVSLKTQNCFSCSTWIMQLSFIQFFSIIHWWCTKLRHCWNRKYTCVIKKKKKDEVERVHSESSPRLLFKYMSHLLKWQWRNKNTINLQGQRDQKRNRQMRCQQNWTRVVGWVKPNLVNQEMLNFKFSVSKFININPVT